MSKLYSLEAEKALLGCLILNPNENIEYIQSLSPDDFEVWSHGSILKALQELIKNNMAVDIITVSNQMKVGNAKDFDPFGYVSSLCVVDYVISNVKSYFNTVKQLSCKRKAMLVSRKFIDSLTTSEDSFEQIYQAYDKALSNIMDSNHNETMFEPWGPLLLDYLANINNPDADSDVVIDSTIPKINSLTNYLRGGQLVVIAADTGVGKSTLAIQICADQIYHGTGDVLFLSLEMKVKEMSCRLISSATGINYNSLKLYPDKLKDDDWRKITDFYTAIQNKKFALNTIYKRDLSFIEMEINKYIKQNGKPKLIVVDYISLIQADSNLNKVQQVSAITTYLKMLSMQLDCVVIGIQQLNRSSSNRTGDDAIPRLSDLKDSSSVEQDADVVIFLHRKDRNTVTTYNDNENPKSSNDILIRVAKSRNGQEGFIDGYHIGHKMRFYQK